jgi:hypothetical protein
VAAVLAGALAPVAASAQSAAPWLAAPPAWLPERLPVAERGPNWQLQGVAAAISASDATAVRDIDGDWARYHPRGGRNAALQSARLEALASRAGWELGITARSTLLIEGSRGAFDLVHAYRQRDASSAGGPLALAVAQTGVVTAGLRVARSGALPLPPAAGQLQWTAALTALSVRRVQRATVDGTAELTTTGGPARFDVQTLQQDSGRRFGGRGQPDATGSGASADLGLAWQRPDGWWVSLSVVDAASWLRVRGVATEQLALSSATRGVDERGYLDYGPLLTGRDSAQDLRLHLPRQGSLTVGAPAAALWPALGPGAAVGLRWQRIGAVDLPSAWAAAPLAPGWAWQLEAEPRFHTLGVGLQHQALALMLRSDSLRIGHARAFGWQARAQWPW